VLLPARTSSRTERTRVRDDGWRELPGMVMLSDGMQFRRPAANRMISLDASTGPQDARRERKERP
jgi:hypothetical protein